MIALIRLQHEALVWYSKNAYYPQQAERAELAIKAYEEFNK